MSERHPSNSIARFSEYDRRFVLQLRHMPARLRKKLNLTDLYKATCSVRRRAKSPTDAILDKLRMVASGSIADEAQIRQIIGLIIDSAQLFPEEDIPVLIHSFSETKLASARRLKAITRRIPGIIHLLGDAEVINLLSDLASLRVRDRRLIANIVRKVLSRTPQPSPQVLVAMFSTYGQLDAPATSEILVRLADAVAPVVPHLEASELSDLLFSMASMSFSHSKLTAQVLGNLPLHRGSWHHAHLTSILWAMATLRIRSDDIVNQIAEDGLRLYPHFDSLGIALSLWALAVLVGSNRSHQVQDLINRLQSRANTGGGWSDSELTALHQARLILGLDFSPQLEAKITVALATQCLKKARSSPFEKEMALALQELGYSAVAQVFVEGYRIDWLIALPSGKQVAIECDGDRCHLLTDGQRAARDHMKDRVLNMLGFGVIRVLSSEWAQRTQEERRLLIEQRLSSLYGAPLQSTMPGVFMPQSSE